MSAFVEIAYLCDGVATTLTGITGIARLQNYNQLTEGMNDTPTIQVYPEEFDPEVITANDRSAFKAGVRVSEFILNIDLYARSRSHLAEDMNAVVTALDALRAALDSIKTAPFFGLPEVKTYKVLRSRRVNFTYDDPKKLYPGFRIPLALRVW